MKKLTLILLCLLLTGFIANAQGYDKEKYWVGPTLGYGFGNFGYGATGEYGMTENIGLGIDFGLTSFKQDAGMAFPGFSSTPYFKYSLLGFLVTGSYHFMPKNKS